jgi:hypothetical protein
VGIPSMVGFMAFTKPSAITEPLNEFFFHIMEFRLSRSPSRIFFSHNGISTITESFMIFLMVDFTRLMIWGKTLFHIYHKEYLHRIRFVKTLPLDLEPHLQGKEYGPPCSKLNAKFKCLCFRNHL